MNGRPKFLRSVCSWLGAGLVFFSLTQNTFASIAGSSNTTERGVRVYLNPNTGRFWTMDTHEGRNSDPLSLHKYLYAQLNPINNADPSGKETLIGLEIAGAIAQAIESWYDILVVNTGFATMDYLEEMFNEMVENADEEAQEEKWEESSEAIAAKYNLPAWVTENMVMSCIGEQVIFRNPTTINYSQDKVAIEFQPVGGVDKYGTIYDLAEKLNKGDVEKMRPIRITERDGQLVSIDNRRLGAYEKAGKPVPTVMATPAEIAIAENPGPGRRPKFSAGRIGTRTPQFWSKKVKAAWRARGH